MHLNKISYNLIFGLFIIMQWATLQGSNTQTSHSPSCIAVFCSGDNKVSEQFKGIAFNLGKRIAKYQYGLVTGGAQTGLMKEVIDGYCLQTNNRDHLYGVIPEVFRPYNVHHPAILDHNMIWVATLEQRMEYFRALSDVIVVLPGGFGTLHELMEFVVHQQLFSGTKTIILFNSNHYWDNILNQFDMMVEQVLLTPEHRAIIHEVTTVDECIDLITIHDSVFSEQTLENCFWEN